jgi:uncharacterized damage-inducible protein DinB
MKKITAIITVSLVLAFCPQIVQAQESANNFLNQFNSHFDYASRVLSLAKEIPADKYSWRPSEEVSSVEEVYTHIAYYNFYYLENSLNIPAPQDIDVKNKGRP